jgi:pyruvate/2-oxoglutarate dehydrogenase complex dihydrolipoamide acyltransferase (E2) component
MPTVEVKVPDIGDFKDVPVIDILVKPGDTVQPEDPLVTLESDKATMDVPSPAAGTVKALSVKVGDKVSEGSALLTLEGGVAAQPAPAAAKPAAAHHHRHRRHLHPPLPRAEERVRRHSLHPRRAQQRRPQKPVLHRRPTAARPTSNARCSCSARAPAVTRQRSARPTSA